MVVILAFMLIQQSVLAPIRFGFPGLDCLIQSSDAIVIGDLQKAINRDFFGYYEQWEVYIRKTLQGDIPEKESVTLSLQLWGGPEPKRMSKKSSPPRCASLGNHTTYIFFLTKGCRATELPIYSTLVYNGSVLPIAWDYDSAIIESLGPKKAIKVLREDYVICLKEQLAFIQGENREIFH
jgi:hypothetical protein